MMTILKTGSRYVSPAGLELTRKIRLDSNSQRSTYLCLPGARIKDVCLDCLVLITLVP